VQLAAEPWHWAHGLLQPMQLDPLTKEPAGHGAATHWLSYSSPPLAQPVQLLVLPKQLAQDVEHNSHCWDPGAVVVVPLGQPV